MVKFIDCEKFVRYVYLFYNPRTNRFEDEDGLIVWTVFEMVTPNDIYLFRHYKESIVVPHRKLKGVGVELHYPGEGDCSYCIHYDECYPEDDY